MRKNLTIFCVLAVSLLWVGAAFGQNNANAFFKIDTNIATQGYTETSTLVTGIGSSQYIGFKIFSGAWDNAAGFKVNFTWDTTKATYQKAFSGPSSDGSNELTINGADTIFPAEDNILGSPLISAGESGGASVSPYTISYAQQGGTPSATAVGLIYYVVFKTTSSFKTTDVLSIAVNVVVADGAGVEKSLGVRNFNVNSVAVKNTTWGDVKTQFKDF
jgi:hypothetical protein